MRTFPSLIAGTCVLTLASVGLTALPASAACGPGVNVIKSNQKVVNGTECADSIQAGPNVETINALGGDDSVSVAAVFNPNDPKDILVNLGDGNDSLTSRRAGATERYNGGGGNDLIETFTLPSDSFEIQDLDGGEGNDILKPSGWTRSYGGNGNDKVILKEGGSNEDWGMDVSAVFGEAGDDLIDSRAVQPSIVQFEPEASPTRVYLDGGLGADTIRANHAPATDPNGESIVGGAGQALDIAYVDGADVVSGVEKTVIIK